MNTARVWTREGLDAVHPLPEGWAWDYESRLGWHAIAVEDGPNRIEGDTVAVVTGVLYVDSYYPQPVAVAESVILASKGLDSLGAMAAAADAIHLESSAEALALDNIGEYDESMYFRGRATGARLCAAMLRRGTVEP